jgi:hypothetical protein
MAEMSVPRPEAAGLPFTRLIRLEARGAVRPMHVVMLVLLALTGVLVAWWLPMWPETIYLFFNRVFHIEGWADVVLANNYVAFIFFLFWFGILDVLRIYVLPLESGYLDIWLSKPVSRGSYMLARIIPGFAVLLVAGIVSAVVHAMAMILLGLTFDVGAYVGTIAAILGFVLLMLAVTNILLLFVRDSFAALVIGFAVFMSTFLPSIVYMYRPDAYAGAPGLADILVFPTSLMWHPGFAAMYGPVLGTIFVALATASVGLASWILNARDVR